MSASARRAPAATRASTSRSASIVSRSSPPEATADAGCSCLPQLPSSWASCSRRKWRCRSSAARRTGSRDASDSPCRPRRLPFKVGTGSRAERDRAMNNSSWDCVDGFLLGAEGRGQKSSTQSICRYATCDGRDDFGQVARNRLPTTGSIGGGKAEVRTHRVRSTKRSGRGWP